MWPDLACVFYEEECGCVSMCCFVEVVLCSSVQNRSWKMENRVDVIRSFVVVLWFCGPVPFLMQWIHRTVFRVKSESGCRWRRISIYRERPGIYICLSVNLHIACRAALSHVSSVRQCMFWSWCCRSWITKRPTETTMGLFVERSFRWGMFLVSCWVRQTYDNIMQQFAEPLHSDPDNV